MTGFKITTGKPQVVLPDGAETRSYGMLGMRGSGKSNAAVVLAEEFHKQGIPWIALDPKGDWWGIKSSADGRGPGLPVVVFGGPHADVALEPTAAAGVELADVLVHEGLTCIIDMSSWTKSGRIEFLAGRGNREGFAERLFRKHLPEHGTAHLFMEEAHDYLPQQPRGDVGKLIEVVGKFQTEGRNRGWGCSPISQRSARLHNDVLTQVDTLLAFRTVAPPDRDAIEKWVKHHGVARELVASLAELEDGECWLWSPDWLRKVIPGGVQRIRFRRRETFDSGATPVRRRAGQKPRKVVLADIDLKALEERMATAVEKAKEQDPDHLQRRIRELEKKLREAAKARPVEKAEPEIREVPVDVEVPIFRDGEVANLTKAVEQLSDVGGQLVAVGKDVQAAGTQVASALTNVQKAPPRPAPATRPRPSAPQRPRETPGQASRRSESKAPPQDGDFRPTKPQQELLDALSWFEAVGISELTRSALAGFTGHKSKQSSTFRNKLSALNQAGLIEYRSGSAALTDAGRALAEPKDTPATPEALQAEVLANVGAARRGVLEVLLEAYPEAVSRQELSDRTGHESPLSSTFRNKLSALKSMGFIEYSNGAVAALPVLFLEAVA